MLVCIFIKKKMNKHKLFKSLSWVAIIEGITYLLLGITMPLKYIYEMGMPNKIVGMIHGIFFILYCILVFIVNKEVRWSLKTNFWLYLASLIPFGTFVADAMVFRKLVRKSASEK